MPSKFSAILADRAGLLYDQYGEAVVYYAPDGSSQDGLTAIVNRAEAHQVDRSIKSSGELQTAEIQIQASALPKVVRGGRFSVVDSPEVWNIETTPRLLASQWFCTCSRAGTERIFPRRGADNG